MKAKCSFFLLFALFIVLGVTGCSRIEKYPSSYEQLSVLIGQPVTKVCAQLDLCEEEFTETDGGMFHLPVTATYADVSFSVYLRINRQENVVNGIRYVAEYAWGKTDPNKFAQDVSAVSKQLSTAWGDTYVHKELVISDLSEVTLTHICSGSEAFVENNFWDLTSQASETIITYLGHLESADYWNPHPVPGSEKACYYLDFDVIYNPDFEQLGMILTYNAEQYRGSGDYEETYNGIVSYGS